jgi:membrane-associated protein
VESKIIALILTYKYPILYPIAFLEGHVISLIAGFLSRLGYLNPFLAGAVIMCGNLTGDILLYWLGYHKGEKFVLKTGKYFGITEATVAKAKTLFHSHKKKILFFSKISNGLGLAMAVLFTAGLARIPFKEYMAWNVFGEAIWTGSLVTLGFVFGNFYEEVAGTISRAGLIILAPVVVYLGYRLQQYFVSTLKTT